VGLSDRQSHRRDGSASLAGALDFFLREESTKRLAPRWKLDVFDKRRLVCCPPVSLQILRRKVACAGGQRRCSNVEIAAPNRLHESLRALLRSQHDVTFLLAIRADLRVAAVVRHRAAVGELHAAHDFFFSSKWKTPSRTANITMSWPVASTSATGISTAPFTANRLSNTIIS